MAESWEENDELEEKRLFEADMAELINIFSAKMCTYIPFITTAELRDSPHLINRKRLLADVICFVTAPRAGKSHMLDKLTPVISGFIRNPYPSKVGDMDEDWLTLQCLGVIYAFGAGPYGSSPKRVCRSDAIPRLSIMQITECAVNLGVDRSIERVQGFIDKIPKVGNFKAEDVATLPSYKKYIFWLWLFTMSHYHSVISRSTAAVPDSNAIVMASKLLGNIPIAGSDANLLAEVKLCRTLIHEKMFQDWPCQPSSVEDPQHVTTQGLMKNVSRSLEIWSKLAKKLKSSRLVTEHIDFNIRFTRFAMMAHLMYNAHLPDKELQNFHEDTIKTVIAEAVCFLKLGPAEKEALPYFRDIDVDKVTWACLFVVQAAEKYGGVMNGILEHLDAVNQSIELMTEKCVGLRQAATLRVRSAEAKRYHTAKGPDKANNDLGDIESPMRGFFSAFPNSLAWSYFGWPHETNR